MIKYPYRRQDDSLVNDNKVDYSNRGMDFEHAVNMSNQYYLEQDLALIYKRPTPIHIVKVDYSNMKIKDAYFEKQSTTDYNGIYKGKYIDFECKETKSKSSLPINNISPHQVEHLKRVIKHQGIAFFMIYFSTLKEVYLLDASFIINFLNTNERKSIPYNFIKENGHLVLESFKPRLNYLDVLDKVYFK